MIICRKVMFLYSKTTTYFYFIYNFVEREATMDFC